ncbi:hypothetical protein [Neosynechococcus sphagnicola]|uniref:hypothetical protein n=1 Tax=Neosynechococcus sphagnicola TaxID=1501145 RepID=UPI00195528AF|nr:hypothetical protein [Neosynechococcus sphagnicola]
MEPRGFFVTYLTSESTFADQAAAAVLQALQSAPQVVAELLVKNLAMSTAMAVHHRRHQDEVMAQGSDRVRSRTTQLLQQLDLPVARTLAQQLLETIAQGEGIYQPFLQRWGYDSAQLQEIQQTVQQVCS